MFSRYAFFLAVIVVFFVKLRHDGTSNKRHGIQRALQYGMIVYYGIVPAALFLLHDQYKRNLGAWGFSGLNKNVFNAGNDQFLRVILIVLIGIASVFTAQLVFRKTNIRAEQPVRNPASVNSEGHFDTWAFGMGVLLFTSGVLGLISYIYSLGGFSKAISLAETLRGFSDEASKHIGSVWSYGKVPARFLPAAALLFEYLLLTHKKRKALWFLFTAALVFSFLTLLLNAGRAPIILFTFCVIYPLIRRLISKRWVTYLVIPLIVLALPVLGVLDQLFITLSDGKPITLQIRGIDYLEYLRQFSFPTQILFNVNGIVEEYGLLYFRSYITDVFSILPGVSFEETYIRTSAYFGGENWRLIGGIPNDLLSFGFLNLREIGVFLNTFFCAGIAIILDNVVSLSAKSSVGRDFLRVILGIGMILTVQAADVQPIIMGSMPWFIILITLFLSHITRKKRHRL